MFHLNLTNETSKHLKKICKKFGIDIFFTPKEITKEEHEILNHARPFTLTYDQAMLSLIDAVEYIEKNKIKGDFVECGVWKGGSILIITKTLQKLGINNRDIYLFDTFEGMNAPTDKDIGLNGEIATIEYKKDKYDMKILGNSTFLEHVKKVVLGTGYDKSKFHFIKGKVEDTLPKNNPKSIALLRLDTDWYESTKHELECLFPLLSKGGILIIDDYTTWTGAKKAADEYFQKNNVQIFLNRIYPQGQRIGVKI